jgi:nucleoside phosphorylase
VIRVRAKLTQNELHELHKAAISTNLVAERSALMSHIAPAFVASLPEAKSPGAQLLSDLNSLNGIVLKDGTLPLAIWLQEAILLCGERSESVVFQRMLERCREAPTNRTEGVQHTNENPAALIDFAIVTAIEVERRAVCEALGIAENQRVSIESRIYWRGQLRLGNGDFYEIVVVKCTDMGNVDAAIVTNDLLHHWKPTAALMVGIAAMADKEVHLGDVVLGSDVYYHERGKVTAAGIKPDAKMIPADSVLWNKAQALQEWHDKVSIERPDGSAQKPKICHGVIASGERVIADAAIRDDIASKHRKIRAIEMEGYGFSRAVWQNFNNVRHLVVRGICDDASENKGDAWHLYAAAVAADFTKRFLLNRPLDPRNKPHP